MTQGRAIPAFSVIKPWLCRNLVDLNTTVFTTYDDKRLMASSGSLIVVGTARRITQETVGFLIEMVDIQEAIMLEASVLGQIPQIVETFYDSASEIYKSSLRASDQTRRLIEVWQQRRTLMRHRVGSRG